ncbi:MAG: FAD-dependent oxidoreductase [Armatimonadetes bacterium]|nr:FAD-dependent oxidoreductase [Armatimonadota bacterium]
MPDFDILIIGGSAAGSNAAVAARKLYPEKSIAVVRREEAAVIPWHIYKAMRDEDSLRKQAMPDTVYTRNRVTLLIGEATVVDRQAKTVELSDGRRLGYDRLLLATGSSPFVPRLPGVDLPGVFPVRKNIPHLAAMREALAVASSVAIIGGGFVGVEFASELGCRDGLQVTLVELLPRCLAVAFDESMSSRAESLLRDSGVEILTQTRVAAILGTKRVEAIRLADEREFPADVVLLAVGERPETHLGEASGLPVGACGGFVVDDRMRTPDPTVFAAGDCAEKTSFFGEASCPLRTATIAAAEARIAAANLYGDGPRDPGTIEAYSTTICGAGFVTVGLNEGTALGLGREVVVGVAENPDARVKLLFDRNTADLVGFQGVGRLPSTLVDRLLAAMRTSTSLATVAENPAAALPGVTDADLLALIAQAAQAARAAL